MIYKLLISIVIAIISITSLAVEDVPAPYKGYVEINKQIFKRVLLKNANQIELGQLIGELNYPGSLLQLLGQFPDGVSNGVISNGTPNSINLMIYHMVFDRLAQKLKNCSLSHDPNFSDDFQPGFLDIYRVLCEKPVNTISTEDYLKYWLHIQGYSAPKNEFLTWQNYHTNILYQNTDEQIYAMTISLLMNPYFILKN